MDNNTIEAAVVRIIASTIHVEEERVTPDLSIGEIPEWDSMGNLSIIAALESQLDVEFPMEDLFELTSVKNIINEIKTIKK
jgi:acyl carrier protein